MISLSSLCHVLLYETLFELQKRAFAPTRQLARAYRVCAAQPLQVMWHCMDGQRLQRGGAKTSGEHGVFSLLRPFAFSSHLMRLNFSAIMATCQYRHSYAQAPALWTEATDLSVLALASRLSFAS